MENSLKSPALSLSDLLTGDYIKAVCEARGFLKKEDPGNFLKIAEERVEFFPAGFAARLDELVEYVGQKVAKEITDSPEGATTNAFHKATSTVKAPVSALGFIRIGEDGRVYLASKSEHYHAPLGHDFPGYQLVENARILGIPNATHNNTRGTITRLLETELVRIANGINKNDSEGLKKVLESTEPHRLNRVINLETGSLAVEAALKMMLARFYRLDKTRDKPEYDGRIPVFLVIADHKGGKEANYHGTTILTQLMRGMWPQFYQTLENNGIFRVESVKINSIRDFRNKIDRFDKGKYKIAGFFHEIVLMNYGGILLSKEFLTEAYKICHERDIPVLVDEIQSCLWSPDLFMFREYELNPDFVSIGKGFPGGQYPASRILTTAAMDNLNLFGALVTNGQEELASLTYLITMHFAEVNAPYTREIGNYYEAGLKDIQQEFPGILTEVEGKRHLSTLFFKTAEEAIAFAGDLSARGIDISVQTYKAYCPPAALTKIPLISSQKMVDFLLSAMRRSLEKLSSINK